MTSKFGPTKIVSSEKKHQIQSQAPIVSLEYEAPPAPPVFRVQVPANGALEVVCSLQSCFSSLLKVPLGFGPGRGGGGTFYCGCIKEP